jgi:hypothetical protein
VCGEQKNVDCGFSIYHPEIRADNLLIAAKFSFFSAFIRFNNATQGKGAAR